MNPASSPLPETSVARTLGLRKPILVSARQTYLTKGDDWVLDGAVVKYTAPGLKKLLDALRLDARAFSWPADGEAGQTCAEDKEEPPEAQDGAGEASGEATATAPAPDGSLAEKLADAAAPSGLVELTVEALSRNPTILFALDAEGHRQTVRVGNNANFAAGMKLTARAPAQGDGLFYFEGRLPRWRGRY